MMLKMALKADDSTALTAVIAGSTELGVHKFKLEGIVLDDSRLSLWNTAQILSIYI